MSAARKPQGGLFESGELMTLRKRVCELQCEVNDLAATLKSERANSKGLLEQLRESESALKGAHAERHCDWTAEEVSLMRDALRECLSFRTDADHVRAYPELNVRWRLVYWGEHCARQAVRHRQVAREVDMHPSVSGPELQKAEGLEQKSDAMAEAYRKLFKFGLPPEVLAELETAPEPPKPTKPGEMPEYARLREDALFNARWGMKKDEWLRRNYQTVLSKQELKEITDLVWSRKRVDP